MNTRYYVKLLVPSLLAMQLSVQSLHAETRKPAVQKKAKARAAPAEDAADDRSEEKYHGPRFTYDLGASFGSSSGTSFYEINFGLNYFILPWFVFRNAPFYRFQSGADALYGLDSSLRASHTFDLADAFKPGVLGGAGYRIANASRSAPFGELGLSIQAGSLNIGASVKAIFNEVVNNHHANEMIYSFNLSGSGSF
jgi:hypothetical protein